MTATKKRRMKRRRKFVRMVKRTIMNILLAPARMPRVTVGMISQAMHASEIAAVVFVSILIAHMFNPVLFKMPLVVLSALVFIGLLTVVKLGDYQDQLEELQYFVGTNH